MNEDMPWLALRRRAMACGIGERDFWAMSPAALIAITAGMEKRGAGVRRAAGAPAPAMRRGSLTDCP